MDLDDRRRRVHGARRAVGLRQDDGAAHARRARGDLARARARSASASSTTCRRATATSRWCSRATRSIRTSRSTRTSPSACACRRCRRTRSTGACATRPQVLGLEAVPRAQAARPLRRPAPARRHGARDRARAAGVPHGRAALQPRRQAARADARGDPQPAARARRDDDLRHARPDRGDDDGRPRRRDAQGRAAAGAPPQELYDQPRQPVRRRLHRQPRDEHGGGDGGARRTAASSCASASSARRSAPRRCGAHPALDGYVGREVVARHPTRGPGGRGHSPRTCPATSASRASRAARGARLGDHGALRRSRRRPPSPRTSRELAEDIGTTRADSGATPSSADDLDRGPLRRALARQARATTVEVAVDTARCTSSTPRPASASTTADVTEHVQAGAPSLQEEHDNATLSAAA